MTKRIVSVLLVLIIFVGSCITPEFTNISATNVYEHEHVNEACFEHHGHNEQVQLPIGEVISNFAKTLFP